MHAYAGRQFVPFLWWSLVWPGREANSRPTVREADTLPTEPTRHGQRFKYNLIDSPSCDHCTQDETPIHYFIYCPAYSDHRNIFKNRLQAELSIDISDKQKLLNTILHGLNNTVTNKILIDIINEFMTLTKRFCWRHTHTNICYTFYLYY